MEDKLQLLPVRVRQRRVALGLTQARLAEDAGVSVELVSRVERGRCRPSVASLVAFAIALETTPNELLGFRDPRATRDARHLQAAADRLPRARRRELLRIAEALVHYHRS